MRNYHETDSSINQILELLRNYRNQGKYRDTSDFSFDSKAQFSHPQDLNFTSYILTNRHQQNSINKENLNASFEHCSTKSTLNNPVRVKEYSSSKYHKENIFKRLYEQNKQLVEKRERLFQEGKKQKKQKQILECTHSPNLRKNSKCSKYFSNTQIDEFYRRSIDWKDRINQTIRQKQCEKNQQNLTKNLTFSPSINVSRSKSKSREKSILEAKGVTQFIDRQKKARQADDLLRSRRATIRSNQGCLGNKNFIF